MLTPYICNNYENIEELLVELIKNSRRMETGIYQASKALLQGFMVVSRYHDQETNTYWSLVAVPK